MSNFLGRLLKRNAKNNTATKTEAAQNQQTQQPKYDFVKKYVVVDPKKIFTRYDGFAFCKTVPVAIESPEDNGGWIKSVQLPRKIFLGYLMVLKTAPIEVSQNPVMRTVYEIRLQNEEQMYLLPNIKNKKNPVIVIPANHTLPFYVTPQINRAIADCLKTFTR